MVVEPAATPVTTPLAFTVAIAAFAEFQVTVLSARMPPFWSRTSAVIVTVTPTATWGRLGDTTTVVTTGVGGAGFDGSEPPPPHATRVRAVAALTTSSRRRMYHIG
jgi:hypothetical protein